jgi:hypothetical protein
MAEPNTATTPYTDIPGAAILLTLLGGITDGPACKRRLAAYLELQAKATAAESELAAEQDALAEHERGVRGRIQAAREELERRRDDTVAAENTVATTIEWLEAQEVEWHTIRLPAELRENRGD